MRGRDELVGLADGDTVVDELEKGSAGLRPGCGVDGIGLEEGCHGVDGGELLLLVRHIERDSLGKDHGLRAGDVDGGGYGGLAAIIVGEGGGEP